MKNIFMKDRMQGEKKHMMKTKEKLSSDIPENRKGKKNHSK